jgi:hypothetical protein
MLKRDFSIDEISLILGHIQMFKEDKKMIYDKVWPSRFTLDSG